MQKIQLGITTAINGALLMGIVYLYGCAIEPSIRPVSAPTVVKKINPDGSVTYSEPTKEMFEKAAKEQEIIAKKTSLLK